MDDFKKTVFLSDSWDVITVFDRNNKTHFKYKNLYLSPSKNISNEVKEKYNTYSSYDNIYSLLLWLIHSYLLFIPILKYIANSNYFYMHVCYTNYNLYSSLLLLHYIHHYYFIHVLFFLIILKYYYFSSRGLGSSATRALLERG